MTYNIELHEENFAKASSVARQRESVPRSVSVGRKISNMNANIARQPATDVSVDSVSHQIQMKRRWAGIVEIVFNVLGTFGFVVGSLLWALGAGPPGTLLFAASCACCGISCSIYAWKFYFADDFISVYALLQQTAGCLCFVIASFLFLVPDFLTIGLIGFFLASVLFLTGCVLTQIHCRSWCGLLAPLWNGRGIIPSSLFNTLGSVFFVLGSVFLFYTWGQILGAWLYEVGSIVFFLASWGDATVWWQLGLTPIDSQKQSTEEEYASIKFL